MWLSFVWIQLDAYGQCLSPVLVFIHYWARQQKSQEMLYSAYFGEIFSPHVLWIWIILPLHNGLKTGTKRLFWQNYYSPSPSRFSDFPPSFGCESYQASCWITSHCVSSLCRRALLLYLTVWVRDFLNSLQKGILLKAIASLEGLHFAVNI